MLSKITEHDEHIGEVMDCGIILRLVSFFIRHSEILGKMSVIENIIFLLANVMILRPKSGIDDLDEDFSTLLDILFHHEDFKIQLETSAAFSKLKLPPNKTMEDFDELIKHLPTEIKLAKVKGVEDRIETISIMDQIVVSFDEAEKENRLEEEIRNFVASGYVTTIEMWSKSGYLDIQKKALDILEKYFQSKQVINNSYFSH